MLGLTRAGRLIVRLFEAQGLDPGFKSGKRAFANFQTVKCDDRKGFKGKAEFMNDVIGSNVQCQMCVINHNACVRTRVFERCIFYLVRGLRVSVHTECSVAAGCYYTLFCPTSHPWCQKHSPPALHLHFKRPAGERRAPHFH